MAARADKVISWLIIAGGGKRLFPEVPVGLEKCKTAMMMWGDRARAKVESAHVNIGTTLVDRQRMRSQQVTDGEASPPPSAYSASTTNTSQQQQQQLGRSLHATPQIQVRLSSAILPTLCALRVPNPTSLKYKWGGGSARGFFCTSNFGVSSFHIQPRVCCGKMCSHMLCPCLWQS